MHRIDTANAVADLFGAGKKGFGAGDPATNKPATFLDKDWCNTVQEELVAIVEAKFILDKADRGQVLKALKSMFMSNDQIIDRTGLAATLLLDRFDVIHKYRADRVTNPVGGLMSITTGMVEGGVYKMYVSAADSSAFSNNDLALRPNFSSFANQFSSNFVNMGDPLVSNTANSGRLGYASATPSASNAYFNFDTFNGGAGSEVSAEWTLFPTKSGLYKKVLLQCGDTAGVMNGVGIWYNTITACNVVGALQTATNAAAGSAAFYIDVYVRRVA